MPEPCGGEGRGGSGRRGPCSPEGPALPRKWEGERLGQRGSGLCTPAAGEGEALQSRGLGPGCQHWAWPPLAVSAPPPPCPALGQLSPKALGQGMGLSRAAGASAGTCRPLLECSGTTLSDGAHLHTRAACLHPNSGGTDVRWLPPGSATPRPAPPSRPQPPAPGPPPSPRLSSLDLSSPDIVLPAGAASTPSAQKACALSSSQHRLGPLQGLQTGVQGVLPVGTQPHGPHPS